jgi:hypothetical protein
MIEKLKLNSVLKLIADPAQPFTFSRWGDGEWKSVLGRHKKGANNCDGHKFFPAMGTELANVLKSKPDYWLGMQHFSMRAFGPAISTFLSTHDLDHLRWRESDVFHYGAIKGHLRDIVDVVKARKLLLVGPPHLKVIKNSGLPYWQFIEVPPRNCYLNLQEMYRQIVAIAEGQKDPLLISISASMPAEILCDKLYKRFGDKHTIVDFGSLWDPMVGKLSRSYMRNKKK